MSEQDMINKKEEIIVRNIQFEDLEKVAALSFKCFGPDMSLKYEHIESQLKIFPEGQVCVEFDGKIVGTALSLIVNIDDYNENHNYDEICGQGYIRNHNPNGVNLYGIEVGVDPDYRKMKLGRKLYDERKRICRSLNLESIIIGGRMPNYHKYAKDMTPEEYVQAVINDEIYDPVVTFQKQNGFIFRRVIPNYLKDEESLHYATSMEWINKDYKG